MSLLRWQKVQQSVDTDWLPTSGLSTSLFNEVNGFTADDLTADNAKSESVLEPSYNDDSVEKNKNDKPRRVGFHVDACGHILCHVSRRPFPLTRQDKKNSWWSRKELKATCEEAKTFIKYVVKFSPAYKEAVQQVLSALNETIPSLKEPQGKGEKTDEEAFKILSGCEARGLEKPLFKLMGISCPRTCVSRLLKLQIRLIQDGCKESERVSVLARQYQNDTKGAKVWARWLAVADAIVTEKGTKVMYSV